MRSPICVVNGICKGFFNSAAEPPLNTDIQVSVYIYTCIARQLRWITRQNPSSGPMGYPLIRGYVIKVKDLPFTF